MKKFIFIYSLLCVLLASCSDGNDYLDAVPKKSPLVASLDLTRYEGMTGAAFLKTLFQIDNMDGKGIDAGKKVYAFESPNGYYGLCLSVADQSALKDILTTHGYKLSQFRGSNFTVLGSSWVVGFDDDALLVMGPVNPNEQRNVMIDMAGYLGQDSEKGLRASTLISRLDSIQAPVALVSAMKSLPELMRSSLMLCAPNEVNIDKLYYFAGISLNGDYIQVDGSLYSSDDKDDGQLKSYQKEHLGLISGKYLQYIDNHDFVSILLNTKTPLTTLTQGKADFEKLFAALNASSKSDIDYKSVFAGASDEILVGVPPHSGNLRLLISHMDTAVEQSVCSGQSADRIGRLADGTFCLGNASGQSAVDGKLNKTLVGKRAAMMVNLNDLQRVAPLPLLTNVQRVLGDRQTMVLMVR